MKWIKDKLDDAKWWIKNDLWEFIKGVLTILVVMFVIAAAWAVVEVGCESKVKKWIIEANEEMKE